MKYIKVRWVHNLPNAPVVLYSELNPERWEIRKVEVYADGRADCADAEVQTGSTNLGIEPLPAPEEIAADPQFIPLELSAEEFQFVWEKAKARQRL